MPWCLNRSSQSYLDRLWKYPGNGCHTTSFLMIAVRTLDMLHTYMAFCLSNVYNDSKKLRLETSLHVFGIHSRSSAFLDHITQGIFHACPLLILIMRLPWTRHVEKREEDRLSRFFHRRGCDYEMRKFEGLEWLYDVTTIIYLNFVGEVTVMRCASSSSALREKVSRPR